MVISARKRERAVRFIPLIGPATPIPNGVGNFTAWPAEPCRSAGEISFTGAGRTS